MEKDRPGFESIFRKKRNKRSKDTKLMEKDKPGFESIFRKKRN